MNRVSPLRLPRLLLVTVLAFAAFESRPLMGTVQLFRGLGIQLAYRWGSRQVMTDTSNAVLMWSRLGSRWDPRRVARELTGVVCAVLTGLAMALASLTLITLVLSAALDVAGIGGTARAWVIAAVVAVRLFFTLRGAWQALRVDHKRMRLLDVPAGEYWRVDYLAAQPLGAGHGGRLLEAFLIEADAVDAAICLVTDPRNREFYRRHGFHLAGVADPRGDLGDRLLMVRRASSQRRGHRSRIRQTIAA